MRNRALRVCVAASLMFVACAVAESKETQRNNPETQKPVNITQQPTAPPIVVNVSPAQKTNEEIEQEAKEHDEKTEKKLVAFTEQLANYTGWLVVVTGALFAATAGLAYLGLKQARLTEKTLKLAGDEFNATHRPKIRVRFIQYQGWDENKIWSAFLTIANIEDTEATIVAIGADIARRNVGDKQWHAPGLDYSSDGHPPPPDPILKCGMRRTYGIFSRGPITAHDFEYVRTGQMDICAVGEIRYRDESGNIRFTGFYWRWNWESQTFDKTNDTEFSYED